MIPWWNVTLDHRESDAVAVAIANRTIGQGPLTAKFEKVLAERYGVPHVVCTTSGTVALMMTYLAIGMGPGDEVIMPSITWVATANAALMLGAKVVLIDSRPDNLAIDEERIEQAITPRTRLIVPVPLNGSPVNIKRIVEIGQKHGIAVVEDACQSLFSWDGDRLIGTNTRFACFSLGMAKALTTGQGGFVVCHTEEDAELLRRIRNQGLSDQARNERHNQIGGNFKFTDIQAAIGLSQMDRVDGRLDNQKALYRAYVSGLQGVNGLKIIPVNLDNNEVPLRTEVSCLKREAFVQEMMVRKVELISMSPCLHEYPFLEGDPDQFPHSTPYGKNNLILPSGPDQPVENAHRTVEIARDVLKKLNL